MSRALPPPLTREQLAADVHELEEQILHLRALHRIRVVADIAAAADLPPPSALSPVRCPADFSLLTPPAEAPR